MTREEIFDLIVKAKELGVKSIKVHGLEAEFFVPGAGEPLTFASSETNPFRSQMKDTVVPELKAKDIVSPQTPFDNLSEEQILYAASEGVELKEDDNG